MHPRSLWLVLALLLGLLGMHGLSSDHTGMPSIAATPAAAAHPDAMTSQTVDLHPRAAVDSAALTDSAAAADHTGMAMAGLCLAVLVAVLLLRPAAARGLPARARPKDRVRARLRALARALRPPRPPDLVAGLCVSRT